jgi:hypothetical protein
MKTSR